MAAHHPVRGSHTVEDLLRRTAISDPKKMNDRSFGHIHMDSRLGGSFLEGMDFLDTTGILNSYLDFYKDDADFKLAQDIFDTCRDRFKDLPKYKKKLREIPKQDISDGNFSAGRDVLAFQNIAKELLEDLDRFGKVFVPGGWAGIRKSPGHMMMYELQKIGGKIFLLVHNTGSGIQFHSKSKDTFKDKYSPVLAYEFEDTEANRNALIRQGLPELLMTQVVPKWVDKSTPFSIAQRFNFTAETLYQEVIPTALRKSVIGYDFNLVNSTIPPNIMNLNPLNKRKVHLIRYGDEIWIYGKGLDRRPTMQKLGTISEIPGFKELEKYFHDAKPNIIKADPKFDILYEYILQKKMHYTLLQAYPPKEIKTMEIGYDSNEDNSEERYDIRIGKLIDNLAPFVKKEDYISGQISGTCSMRILIEVLRNLMPKPIFLKFLYKIKLQSLIDYYIAQKGENRLNEPVVQGFLRPSLEKFARFIDFMIGQSEKVPPLVAFTSEEAILGRQLIEHINVELEKALIIERKDAAEEKQEKESIDRKTHLEHETHSELESESLFTLDTSLKTSTELKLERELKESLDLPRPLPLWDPKSGINFNSYLESCLKTALENESNGHSLAVVNALEKIFLSFPVSRLDFFKQFVDPLLIANKSKKEVEEFARSCHNSLTQLMGLYRKHTAKHFDLPFPKRMITTMSAVNVARNLNQMVWNADKYWEETQNYRIRFPLYATEISSSFNKDNLKEEAEQLYKHHNKKKIPLLLIFPGAEDVSETWILGVTRDGSPILTKLNSNPDNFESTAGHFRFRHQFGAYGSGAETVSDWRIPQSLYEEILEKNAHHITSEIPTQESVRRLLSSYHLVSKLHYDSGRVDRERELQWHEKESINFDKPYLLAIDEFQANNPSYMATYEYEFDTRYQELQTAFSSEKSDIPKSHADEKRSKESLKYYSSQADDYFINRMRNKFPDITEKLLKFAITKLGPLPFIFHGSDQHLRIRWIKAAVYNITNGSWEAPETMADDPNFKNLLDDFYFSLRTRDVATHCMEVLNGEAFDERSLQLLDTPEKRFKRTKVEITVGGGYGNSKEIECLDGSFHPGTTRPISEAHPAIEDLELKSLLEKERLEGNVSHLQYRRLIRGKTKGITQKESILRFAHARVKEAGQITGILESFIDNPGLLREQDCRNFLMLNVFQPNLLERCLKDTPEYMGTMIDFIRQSIFYFTDGQRIEESGLLCLRLGATLEKYCQDFTKNNPEHPSSKMISEHSDVLTHYLDNFLSKQLEENNKQLKEHGIKKNILIRQGEIYRVIFSRLQTRLEKTGGKLEKEEVSTLIRSLFFNTTIPKSQSGQEIRTFNPNTARQSEEILSQCMPLLKAHFSRLPEKELSSLLNSLLRLLPSSDIALKALKDIPDEAMHWEGRYPVFQLDIPGGKSLYFDCRKMVFKHENVSLKSLPDYFYGNKAFIQSLGKNEHIVEVFDDLDYFCGQFTHEDGHHYRVIAHDPNNPHNIIIQRKFKEQWLQLQDSNLLDMVDLPETLKNGQLQCWAGVSIDGEQICHITVKGGNSRACLSELSKESEKIGSEIANSFSKILEDHFEISRENRMGSFKKYCDSERPVKFANANSDLQEHVYPLNIMSVDDLPIEMSKYNSKIPLLIKCNERYYIYGYPTGKESGIEPKLILMVEMKDKGFNAWNDYFLEIPKNQIKLIDKESVLKIYNDTFHEIKLSKGHTQEREEIISSSDPKIDKLLMVGTNQLAQSIMDKYKIVGLIKQHFGDFDFPKFDPALGRFQMARACVHLGISLDDFKKMQREGAVLPKMVPLEELDLIKAFLTKKDTPTARRLLERINALFKCVNDFEAHVKEIWRHRAHGRSVEFMEERGVFGRLDRMLNNIGKGALIPWKVDEHQNKINYGLMDVKTGKGEDKKIIEYFSRVEDPKFLEIWKSCPFDRNAPYIISLPRYNIELIAKRDPKTQTLYYETKNPPNFRLKIPNVPPELPWLKELPGFESFLPLERLEEVEVERIDKDGKVELIKEVRVVEKVALVPVQQFLPTDKEDHLTGYYKVDFDKSNTVVTTLLENRSRQERGLATPLPGEENVIAMENWKLLGSEHYKMYSLDAEGKLQSKSSSDFLYLAYLQLAAHKPMDALETLKGCQKGLEGTKEEIELLRRIMMEIPFKSGQERSLGLENEVIFSYPEVLAVRAYTASLMAQFKYKNNVIEPEDHSKLRNLNDDNYNEYYKKIWDEKTVKFYNNDFYEAAYRIYYEYHIRKGNIPIEMQLKESEEQSLTRQIFSHNPHLVLGPIGFRAKALELRSLNMKRKHLLLHGASLELKKVEEEIAILRKTLLNQTPERFPEKPSPILLKPKVTDDPPYDLSQELGIRTKIEEWSKKSLEEEDKEGKELKAAAAIFEESEIKAEEDPFLSSFMRETNKDYIAGIEKNKAIYRDRTGLLDWLKNEDNRKNLKERLLTPSLGDEGRREKSSINLRDGKEQLKKLREEIEVLAGLKVSGKEAGERSKLKVMGRKRIEPKLASGSELKKTDELFALFLKGDMSLYKKKTGLNETEIKSLHDRIDQYLLLHTQLQQKARVYDLLKKLEDKMNSPDEQQAFLLALTEQLKAKRCYTAKENPEMYSLMLLWEYYENKLIRPQQKDLIVDLLTKDGGKYKSQVIQMLMGEGKTKVLWTLLAMKQADGITLPTIVVPKPLLKPTYNDLVAITAKFNKKCHQFLFSRDKPVEKNYFGLLFKQLQDIIRDGEFLITTPDSMQALELKLIDLLSQKPKVVSEILEWKNQISNLSNILKLFRRQSHALIDEVDTALSVKDELNYTLGEAESIKPEKIHSIIQLFNLFDSLSIDVYAMLEKPDVSLNKVEWEKLFDELATLVVESDESPLYSFCQELTPLLQKTLKNYLLDKTIAVPDFVLNATSEEREKIDLIKGYLTNILPKTLKNKRNLHYGFSKLPEKNNYEMAIPYVANNIPNEASHFEMPEITLAYSLQIHKRPSHEVSIISIQNMLSDFYDRVEKEMQLALEQGEILERSKTRAALEFFQLTGDQLADIPLADIKKCDDFRIKMSTKTKVKDYCLEHYVLNKIDQSPEVIRSNSHNFASQFASVEAATGTPWNRGTFPEFLKFNERGTLGTDGQVLDLLISQNVPVYLCDEKKPKLLLKKMFDMSKYKDTTRAFIDVGAFFAGVPNETVARDFSNYFLENRHPIKYVLFFDESNQLCALPVASVSEGKHPIPLKSTDPDYIAKKLGCKPDQCFTYYDEWHTRGIDIRQMVNANAFITASEKTLKSDFAQGAYRMRGLASGQTLESFISSEVAINSIGKSACVIKDIAKMTTINTRKRLAGDHFVGAIQEIQNFVRNDLFERILNLTDPEVQHDKLACCRNAFSQKSIQSATARFGGVKSEPETKILLEDFAKTCYEQWLEFAKEAGFELFDIDKKNIDNKIRNCVAISLPRCLKQTRTRLNPTAPKEDIAHSKIESRDKKREKESHTVSASDNITPMRLDSTTQAQKHRQRETETADQKEKQEAVIPSGVLPIRFYPWTEAELAQPIDKFIASNSLNTMAWPDYEDRKRKLFEPFGYKCPYSWSFSDNIHVSPNFLETDNYSPNYMAHKKPVLFYAMIEDNRELSGRPSAERPRYYMLLITPEEAEALKVRGPSKEDDHLKISVRTAHGKHFGCDKLNTDNEKCKALIEQIEFFNGDAHLLSRKAKSSQWFEKEYPEEVVQKIHFLENTILPSHPEKKKFLAGLKQKLSEVGRVKALLHSPGPDKKGVVEGERKRTGDQPTIKSSGGSSHFRS